MGGDGRGREDGMKKESIGRDGQNREALVSSVED